jgi:hypothetical protein
VQAAAFLGQVAAAHLGNGDRGRHQSRLQMNVALADLAVALLAGTLVVARTDPGPGG